MQQNSRRLGDFMQDNIIQLKKQILFKNANKINLETGEVVLVDILVEGDTIVKVVPSGEIGEVVGEVVDLKGNYVMPPFVNVFSDSIKALEHTYGLELKGLRAEHIRENISQDHKRVFVDGADALETYVTSLMVVKNILAGAVYVCDVSLSKHKLIEKAMLLKCIENIEQYSEQELDQIVEEIGKKIGKVFLKIGQSLDELGSVDKLYKKPISQVLEDFGFLDRKPVIVGGNCLEKDELQLLKDYDCKFVVCPSEDGKFGRRPTNLKTLGNLGFEIGIGSGYSFEIDFFAFIRQILMNMRGMFEDENVLTEQDVLTMATRNSAEISFGKILKIEKGEKADFIVVKNELSLYDDIFKILVWEKTKKDVLMTVRHGEILQKNGEILMKNGTQCDKIKMLVKKLTMKKSGF